MAKPRFAPLPHEWMIASIIGFFISVYTIWNWNQTWGFTFTCFFGVMFVASIVSLEGGDLAEEDLVELAVHQQKVRAGRHRKTRLQSKKK